MAGNKLDKILEERGNSYGPFSGHALATQQMKEVIGRHLLSNANFRQLNTTEQALVQEGLDMIAHKIGRLVNGDPKHEDSWVDIGGYARVANEFLNPKEEI